MKINALQYISATKLWMINIESEVYYLLRVNRIR